MEKDPFKEYLIESEPDKFYKKYAWSTAIGLQAVDGLKPSKYLIDTAIQNIEGTISIKEAQDRISSYYEEKETMLPSDEDTIEADIVSSRIAELLSERAFTFSPNEYISIHRKLFEGIYEHAGKVRERNIIKKEWVLDGETVIYGSASELLETLSYGFSCEQDFSYKGLSMDEIIHHLALFVSRLWQIHIFNEGNTRTTAVFFIKYLRKLGFSATNDIFAQNAWYFRNALVRANYNNFKIGVHETTEYLELFLRNLLLNEKNELHNRVMHISGKFVIPQKVNVEHEKANIEMQKANDENIKANIREQLGKMLPDLSDKTMEHILRIYEAYGTEELFGRKDIMMLTGLKATRASGVIKLLTSAEVIEAVKGHGKGKYCFTKELGGKPTYKGNM